MMHFLDPRSHDDIAAALNQAANEYARGRHDSKYPYLAGQWQSAHKRLRADLGQVLDRLTEVEAELSALQAAVEELTDFAAVYQRADELRTESEVPA